MKKKIAIISVIIIILLILLFPIKNHLDDGGSIIYSCISQVYEIKKIRTYGNVGMTLTKKEGLSIKLFGKEVYYKIDQEYPIERLSGEIVDISATSYAGEELWKMYLPTMFSSTFLTDGAGTVELVLDKILEDYPADMAADDILAAVKEENYVIFEDLCLTSGSSVWKNFYEKVKKKENAQVKLVKYYTLGDESRYAPEYYEEIKDEYPKLFFFSLVYVDGEGFYVNNRPSTATEPETETQCYKYLKHYEGEAPTSSAAYSKYDRYVLVDDKSVTWEDIEGRMLSSYIEPNDNFTAWTEVYCNFID